MAGPIVIATSEIYTAAIANLLPTPTKSHYLFNLRDFARVMAGLTMVPPACVPDKDEVVRLWVHEVRSSLRWRCRDYWLCVSGLVWLRAVLIPYSRFQ